MYKLAVLALSAAAASATEAGHGSGRSTGTQACVVNGIAYPLGYSYTVTAAYKCANYPTGTMKLWCTSPTTYGYCCGSACDQFECPPIYPTPYPPQPPKPTNTCGQWSVQNGGPTNACGPTGTLNPNMNQGCGGVYGSCANVCCSYTPYPPQPVTPSTTCKIWAAKEFGPSYATAACPNSSLKSLQLCGGSGDYPCSQQLCCNKVPIVY